MKPARILVTGSRDWADVTTLRTALARAIAVHAGRNPLILVHGGARGADSLADGLWRSWAFLACLAPPEVHPADWSRYGRAAGHRRNAEMVALGAAICLAFPLGRSPGTRGCMALATRAGIPVIDCGLPDPLSKRGRPA